MMHFNTNGSHKCWWQRVLIKVEGDCWLRLVLPRPFWVLKAVNVVQTMSYVNIWARELFVGSTLADVTWSRLWPFGLWLMRSGLLGLPGDWDFNTEEEKSRSDHMSWVPHRVPQVFNCYSTICGFFSKVVCVWFHTISFKRLAFHHRSFLLQSIVVSERQFVVLCW